jgi:glucose-6-phosphate 1-epimerase
MSENEIQQHEFGVRFKNLDENIMLAEIDTPLAAAKICLYGGHVISWQPKTQAMPVLWISELARFQYGKAVCGGFPVCWPWFGKHPSNMKLPGHGYARIVNWDLVSIETLNTGEIIFSLSLGK